jgi:hypothetical protein
MTDDNGTFVSRIVVLPPTPLGLSSRLVGEFVLSSINDASLDARSPHTDAALLFQSHAFHEQLERLAWDLVWERQVAVEFQPELGGTRTVTDGQGRSLMTINLEDRILFNPENPRSGLARFTRFDLLQRIRDYLIEAQLSGGDASKNAKLKGNAAVLLAVEHFVKGVVHQAYAMAEFYSVVETVENQIGGRNALNKRMGKSVVDKIVRLANRDEHDQRHPPLDPASVTPLPSNAISEAAAVAKAVIEEFAKGLI